MNKYFLERYPLVWNTRLLPMLALASCGHIFFILLGWTAKNEDFNYYSFNAIMVDFIGITLLLHLIISILLLVVWCCISVETTLSSISILSLKKNSSCNGYFIFLSSLPQYPLFCPMRL